MKKSTVFALILFCVVLSIGLGIWVGTFTYNRFVVKTAPVHKTQIIKVWTPYEGIKCYYMVVDGDTIVGCSNKNIDE